MSPRGKRSELPKPVIRLGVMGYFPLNRWTASYLAEGYGDTVLGFHNANETLSLKQRPTLAVKDGKQSRNVSLEDRYFNGYADALYRGRLPEVLLTAPTEESLPECLEEFAEYLEKLLSLGFFVEKKEIIKRDPVADLIPCHLLIGSGLLFSRFITGLMRYLKEMQQRYPLLDETVRARVINRFVRGIPCPDRAEVSPVIEEADLMVSASSAFELLPITRHLRIAGGNRVTQDRIQSALSAQGLTVSVENRVRNAAERLEFENALWQVSTIILPALAQEDANAVRNLMPRVEAGILAIGRKRQAFDENDRVETILVNSTKRGKKAGKVTIARDSRNEKILNQLSQYAEALGLAEEQVLFQTLAAQMANL